MGILVGCFVTVLLSLSVTLVSAQTISAEDEYRASLLNLIVLLQAQIAELQLQLASQTNVDTSIVLDTIGGTTVAAYTVDGGEISGQTRREYQAYLDRLLAVMPDQYDEHIDEFIIFTGGNNDISAYVETKTPYVNNWTYGVRASEVAEDPDSAASTELMVHEFAHIFSLDQVFRINDIVRTCHSFLAEKICYGNESYIGDFIETFWSSQLLDELQATQINQEMDQTDFYDRYQSQFVSEYAATDPAEDFAESFVWYVYDRSVPRNSIAQQKVAFFDQSSYLQGLAATIREEID